jgi:hypothetical protein
MDSAAVQLKDGVRYFPENDNAFTFVHTSDSKHIVRRDRSKESTSARAIGRSIRRRHGPTIFWGETIEEKPVTAPTKGSEAWPILLRFS